MKTNLCLAALTAALPFVSPAGEILLSESFTTYDGTPAAVPAGWYFSYHGHYTSSSSSGPSGPNAYKFGEDRAVAVTPDFSGAASVSLWIRGFSTDSASKLVVLWTADSLQWDTVAVITNLPTAVTAFAFPLAAAARRLKFVYEKSKGNVAFDDVAVTGSGTTGLPAGGSDYAPVVYPNPVTAGKALRAVLPPGTTFPMRIFDAAGRQVHHQVLYGGDNLIQLHHLSPGLYVLRTGVGYMEKAGKLIVQ